MLKKNGNELGVLAHVCNPSTRDAEKKDSEFPGQPGIHSENLSQNKQTNKQKTEEIKL
jgi:hypothetical protein